MPPKSQGQRRRRRRDDRGDSRKPKACFFCTEKMKYVDYKDIALLRKYVSDRAKIRARRVTGNCARHQRAVAKSVKNAREMALLPYISTRA